MPNQILKEVTNSKMTIFNQPSAEEELAQVKLWLEALIEMSDERFERLNRGETVGPESVAELVMAVGGQQEVEQRRERKQQQPQQQPQPVDSLTCQRWYVAGQLSGMRAALGLMQEGDRGRGPGAEVSAAQNKPQPATTTAKGDEGHATATEETANSSNSNSRQNRRHTDNLNSIPNYHGKFGGGGLFLVRR